MRKLRMAAAISLIAFMVSCRTGSGIRKMTPEDACRIFFNALKDRDFETARIYGTDHTDKVVGFVETMSSLGGGRLVLNDEKDSLKYCIINGSTAVCIYTGRSGKDVEVNLVREKGRWLVHLENSTGQTK